MRASRGTVLIALLRGINVGGHAAVPMASLRELVGSLQFEDVQSVLQSGNLVFRSTTARKPASVEALLEKETEKRLGLAVDYFVRTGDEWAAVMEANPFEREAEADPSLVHVMFLEAAPVPPAVAALRAGITGRERVHAVDRQLYITYPDGSGRSKLTGALIERKLSTRGTARNWNTVRKLHALATAMSHPPN